MPFGRNEARRREAARAHSRREHKCRCGRIIKGNAYYIHRKTCRRAAGCLLDRREHSERPGV